MPIFCSEDGEEIIRALFWADDHEQTSLWFDFGPTRKEFRIERYWIEPAANSSSPSELYTDCTFVFVFLLLTRKYIFPSKSCFIHRVIIFYSLFFYVVIQICFTYILDFNLVGKEDGSWSNCSKQAKVKERKKIIPCELPRNPMHQALWGTMFAKCLQARWAEMT